MQNEFEINKFYNWKLNQKMSAETGGGFNEKLLACENFMQMQLHSR